MGRKATSKRDRYGAWLLLLRKQKGLTQGKLSQLTGIPQRNIAYWERSGKLKGRTEILALAQAFNVTLDDLLRTKK